VLLELAERMLPVTGEGTAEGPEAQAALRGRMLGVLLAAEERRWDDVRRLGISLEGVAWGEVPAATVAPDVREQVAEQAETAGALAAALGLRQDQLARSRAREQELGTPQSRRDVSVSLGKVAGIEEARGDLDAALARYAEALELDRALTAELGTPGSNNDLVWSTQLTARLLMQLGRGAEARAALARAEAAATALAPIAADSPNKCDTLAAFAEVSAAAAHAEGDATSAATWTAEGARWRARERELREAQG
jgi:tetratricopeptide (TPR) repeat protein